MVCAGLQQSHRMTVNPGRIVAINVIQYTWGRCLPIIMMYYNIYIENWNKKLKNKIKVLEEENEDKKKIIEEKRKK